MTAPLTPEELDEIEQSLKDSQPYSRDMPNEEVEKLIATVRQSWAERDELKARIETKLQRNKHWECHYQDGLAAGVAQEREACAQLAHEWCRTSHPDGGCYGPQNDCVCHYCEMMAIRARNKKGT